MAWDPHQYRKFSAARLRPAIDLLTRIELDSPRTIVDLGCGEGTVTQLLRAHWPGAVLTGVDGSADMLRVAVEECPTVQWQQADIAQWQADRRVDLLFSNAALHWLPDHAQLFPRLLRQVAPGGALAVQMPRNFAAPSHTAIADVVLGGPWRERLAPLLRDAPVADPAFYYDMLAPLACRVDIWETEYLHVLRGDHPVAEWTMGTWRRPYVALLSPAEQARFEEEYRQRMAVAYPRRDDGTTLFPFRRLFIVAYARATGADVF